MKLFLDEEEKSQLRRLRQLEKAGVRRMTQDELKKIEHAERMHSYRLNGTFDICSDNIVAFTYSKIFPIRQPRRESEPMLPRNDIMIAIIDIISGQRR